jgi:hypothetical protein
VQRVQLGTEIDAFLFAEAMSSGMGMFVFVIQNISESIQLAFHVEQIQLQIKPKRNVSATLDLFGTPGDQVVKVSHVQSIHNLTSPKKEFNVFVTLDFTKKTTHASSYPNVLLTPSSTLLIKDVSAQSRVNSFQTVSVLAVAKMNNMMTLVENAFAGLTSFRSVEIV